MMAFVLSVANDNNEAVATISALLDIQVFTANPFKGPEVPAKPEQKPDKKENREPAVLRVASLLLTCIKNESRI